MTYKNALLPLLPLLLSTFACDSEADLNLDPQAEQEQPDEPGDEPDEPEEEPDEPDEEPNEEPNEEPEEPNEDPNEDPNDVPEGELIPVENGGEVLDGLLNDCTFNSLTFYYPGTGATGPDIVKYPHVRNAVGNSLVFEQETLGGVGGYPYIAGVLTLTLDGEDPQTGELVFSGSVEGPGSSVTMSPLRLDLDNMPEFYSVLVEAENTGVDPWTLLHTAPALQFGQGGNGPFEYEIEWYLGYSDYSGVGYAPCDQKAGW